MLCLRTRSVAIAVVATFVVCGNYLWQRKTPVGNALRGVPGATMNSRNATEGVPYRIR